MSAATASSAASASKIVLQCVKVGRKLRIRFHSFTDHEGKVYTGVYNQNYNTMFPRDIREEGKYRRHSIISPPFGLGL